MSERLAALRAAYARGDVALALRLADEALALDPDQSDAWTVRANLAIRGGDLDGAAIALQRLLALHPAQPSLTHNLVQVLLTRGSRRRATDRAGALADFEHALRLAPDDSAAAFNLAVTDLDGGRRDRALALLGRIVAATPEDREAAFHLARAELTTDPTAAATRLSALLSPPIDFAAIPLATQVTTLADAGLVDAVEVTLGRVEAPPPSLVAAAAQRFAMAGDGPAARRCLRLVAPADGRPRTAAQLRAMIGAALSLPAVHASVDHLEAERTRYATALHDLDAALDPEHLRDLAPGLDAIAWSNFLLAYQGRDDLMLQSRWGDLVARLLPTVAPGFTHPPSPARRARPRVAFVGSIFRYCTAGVYFASWVEALTAAGAETLVFQHGGVVDAQSQRIAATADRWIDLGGSPLDAIATAIRAADCDVVVYPEVGMDLGSAALAACRLAPFQIAGYGHPVTTGLTSIDAFVVPDAMEPADAASHYRERLWRLPGLATRYPLPSAPAPRTRAELGLPDGPLYVLPQSVFKIHPDTDALLVAIAQRDPAARLLLFDNEAPRSTLRLRRRLAAAFAAAELDVARHLHIAPLSGRDEFLARLACSDVMIDPPHWSGGNTSLDALTVGLPIVALPGRFLRGRQSLAMLATLGIAEPLVAAGIDEAATRAVALAHAPEERRRLAAAIAAGLPGLVDGRAALAALTDRILSHPSRSC